MTQLNFTLNQEEILQLLRENREDAFRTLLARSLNCILKAESAEQLNAAPYERTSERAGNRNGFRDRNLATRIGTMTLRVPKHRDGQPFKTTIFDSYSRSEAALMASMAEMVVNEEFRLRPITGRYPFMTFFCVCLICVCLYPELALVFS